MSEIFMERELDPKVTEFGAYLAKQMAAQQNRPYSEKEDIERRLGIYVEVKAAYQRIFQVSTSHSDLYQIEVNDLDLCIRTRSVLKKMNVKTLGDLVTLTEEDLSNAHRLGMGETNAREIKRELEQRGLSLKPNKSA